MTPGNVVAGVCFGMFVAGIVYGLWHDFLRWLDERHLDDVFAPTVGSKWWLDELYEMPPAPDRVLFDGER